MNLEIYNNVQNKSKIQTGNLKLKCSVIPKSQPTSWKPKPKPTSSKTPQCPQEPPPLETPTSNDVTQEIIFHKTYQSNSVIDLDNFPKPTNHDLDNFNWNIALLLSKVDEEQFLQPNTWLTAMHMNVAFLLLYRTKF
jgi:hypothetical protein